SNMWLSDLFWKRVGNNRKQRVMVADWIDAVQITDRVVKIDIGIDCFDSEGSADIQDMLRKVLYL
ncbi:hypothetical protein SB725_33850, partial [Pseudomonas sp. SIMBA_041]